MDHYAVIKEKKRKDTTSFFVSSNWRNLKVNVYSEEINRVDESSSLQDDIAPQLRIKIFFKQG